MPYFLLVCFAAVYLNHHYLLDIFIGLGIALAVMAVARIAFGAVEVRRSPAEEEEPGLAPART
jgi:membrane-associated phospholipid phosphatase